MRIKTDMARALLLMIDALEKGRRRAATGVGGRKLHGEVFH
jgi:hypothetical protein